VAFDRSQRCAGLRVCGSLGTSQHVIGLEAPALGWRSTQRGVVEDLRRGSYRSLEPAER
jgi:hypothetical protein